MARMWAGTIVAALLAACTGEPCTDPASTGAIRFEGGATLTVRIADEPDERTQGLMGVELLPADEGMIFTWPAEPHDGTFWMKNTLIPLSIAFVDQERRIVTIRDMQPCPAEPCPSYSSDGPYVMAVEANAGWFEQHGLGEGDRIGRLEGTFCE